MTPANFDALCAELAASIALVQAITKALAEAKLAAPQIETGILEDALSDFRGDMTALKDAIDDYEARDEPSPYRMRATYLAGVL